MAKFKKNTKGITLIALVITIIVLLLLAGISITMLTGQNGILTRAGEAEIQTTKDSAKEKLGIILTELQIDTYEKGQNITLDEDFAEKIKNKSSDVKEAIYSNGKIYVKIDGYGFCVNDLLNITEAGQVMENVKVEVVNTTCIRLTSANPSAYANKDSENEKAKIASTSGMDNIKLAQIYPDSVITVITPDGDEEILDLADSESKVEYWAYKSKNYSFRLEDSNGNIDVLDVDVNIPVSSDIVFKNAKGKLELKEFYSYYKSSKNYINKDYITNVINIPNNFGEIYFEEPYPFHLKNINTIILPGGIKLNGQLTYEYISDELKTIYIQKNVGLLGEYALAGVKENVRIYFEASEEDSKSWVSGWDEGCEARIFWNQ